MIDISLDIETFSDKPGAAIATIGAVTSEGGHIYLVVNDQDGHFEPRTIRWHLTAGGDIGDEQRDQVMSLRKGLQKLYVWLESLGSQKDGAVAIWSHATFDIPVLAAGYQRVGRSTPWHYRNCRDLRTLYDLSGGRPTPGEIEAHGDLWIGGPAGQEHTPHHALSDAYNQLKEIQICRARLRKGRTK